MIPFLLKSTLLMVLLLAVYQFFLGREKMHRFSRYYLLAALLFSLVAPFITFETEQTVIPTMSTVVADRPLELEHNAATVTPMVEAAVAPTQPVGFDWQVMLLVAYLIISGGLLIRFALNLTRVARRARMGERQPLAGATLVLMDEPTSPFSFLRFIFVTRKDYQQGDIGPELLTHELTHVRQRHTIDVLLVELLQVVLWFNPLVYLYKRAIRTNHEFLADEHVIDHHQNVKHYQHLLLDTIFRKNTPSLVSNIGYSLTKKRLIMMTKQTSKFKRVIIGSFVLVAISFVAYSFCATSSKSSEQKTKVPKSSEEKAKEVKSNMSQSMVYSTSDGLMVFYLIKEKDGSSWFLNVRSTKNEGIATVLEGMQLVRFAKNQKFSKSEMSKAKSLNELTTEEIETLQLGILKKMKPNIPSQDLINKWCNSTDVSLWIDNKHIEDNTILKNYKSSDFKKCRYITFAQIPEKGPNKGKLIRVQLLTNEGYENYLDLNKVAFEKIKNRQVPQDIKLYVLD